MTTDEKLAAILAAVQSDPGNRGLAKVPGNNLFTATAGDFQAACRSITGNYEAAIDIDTGFFIPTGSPPAFETDGPLGGVFLLRALHEIIHQVAIWMPYDCLVAIQSGISESSIPVNVIDPNPTEAARQICIQYGNWPGYQSTHLIALEHAGRASDGCYYSMRGRDISGHTLPVDKGYLKMVNDNEIITIGIGDGGNEIGMGKIPHETIVANIPNGDLIHCRVATDHLIVAGVSNWGAYALAAGVFALKGVKPPDDLFDPDRERAILEVMVRKGPLVDGVTGKQTATVDGLTWDEYAKPLIRIREILES